MIITIQYAISLDLLFWNQLKSPMIVSDQYQHSKSKDWINWKLSKSAKIGKNSFTQRKNGSGNDQSKSFHILNCESLESIEIGDYSFSDFAGEFELKNLTQLQSIQIGRIGWWSNNFYDSSFEIQGIELILNVVMNRSSKSTIHYIGW